MRSSPWGFLVGLAFPSLVRPSFSRRSSRSLRRSLLLLSSSLLSRIEDSELRRGRLLSDLDAPAFSSMPFSLGGRGGPRGGAGPRRRDSSSCERAGRCCDGMVPARGTPLLRDAGGAPELGLSSNERSLKMSSVKELEGACR